MQFSTHLSPDERQLLVLIEHDSTARRYFFVKLAEAKPAPVKWFDSLMEEGYFGLEKVADTSDVVVEGKTKVHYWYVLPYLEHISEHVEEAESERFIKPLLEIVTGVTRNCRLTLSWISWCSLYRILKNLPTECLSDETVSLVKVLLRSDHGGRFLGAEALDDLLPKFLAAPGAGYGWAGKLIGYLTEVSWVKVPLERQKLLEEVEEPVLRTEPYWLEERLVKNRRAVEVGSKCSSGTVRLVAKRLRNVLAHQKRRSTFSLPPEGIEADFRLRVSRSLDEHCLVRVVLAERVPPLGPAEDGVEAVSQDVREYHLEECDWRDYEGFITAGERLIREHVRDEATSQEFVQGLPYAVEGLFRDESTIHFWSIATGPDFDSTRPQDALTGILRDMLLGMATSNLDGARSLVQELVGPDFPFLVFKRVALLVISGMFEQFQGVFERLLDDTWACRWFNEDAYRVELEAVLRAGVGKFSTSLKAKLLEVLEKGPTGYRRTGPNAVHWTNYWRQQWLAVLGDDSFFKPYHEKYKAATKEPDRRHVRPIFEVRSGPGPSPYKRDQLQQMPGEELARALSTFKTVDHWDGPTVEGLCDELTASVTQSPKMFASKLDALLLVPFRYANCIFWGFRRALDATTKPELDWKVLLDFVTKYTGTEEFWQDKLDPWKQGAWENRMGAENHEATVGVVSDLLESVASSDDPSFDAPGIQAAKQLLLRFAERLAPAKCSDSEDPLFRSMNSTWGKILSAIIGVSLREARLNREDKPAGRAERFRQLRDCLQHSMDEGTPEAFTVFGRFLWNLRYLDQEWTDARIADLLSTDDTKWSWFILGYLPYFAFDKELYGLMRKHYEKAELYAFKSSASKDHVVEHACVGYLRRYDTVSEGLLGDMLKEWRVPQLTRAIHFFRNGENGYLSVEGERAKDLTQEQRDERLRMREDVLTFWRALMERYRRQANGEELTSGDERKLVSATAGLIGFLLELDEESFGWLSDSVICMDKGVDLMNLLEGLDSLKAEGFDKPTKARYVAHLLEDAVKSAGLVPYSNDMTSIFTYLRSVPDDEVKRVREWLANYYLQRGDDTLKKLLDGDGREGHGNKETIPSS